MAERTETDADREARYRESFNRAVEAHGRFMRSWKQLKE